ncbi:glycosyltransferase family 2 protein [Acidisoma cellulosilytica]|uniref:Glycosyltransferase family 2 protein n=1 Tax=Acidisoma cellulosilyticum TaxID=2802395 RepID=A0A963Z7A9_9PROT|nr:glycosyltransferase family A protein [Acidisoma cellulosilyticum]MCB8883911.1 glycosyltransferase family 2 protein [Acidisoma cellulosilyticum]
MSTKVDITAIMTAHTEGVLAGPSIISFEQAIETARAEALIVEGVIVLDRPDVATLQQFTSLEAQYQIIVTDEGDPGLARNAGVRAAQGNFVAFLDGDDLWSRNWLVEAHRVGVASPDRLVVHPEIDVIFGEIRAMWWQVDSRNPDFDVDLLRFANHWDAMSFGARSIYLSHPFVENDLEQGFGHEDWHWNCVTLAAGIDHCPALGTAHFKRRRKGSQLSLCEAVDAVPWMTPVASYDWLKTCKTDVGPAR